MAKTIELYVPQALPASLSSPTSNSFIEFHVINVKNHSTNKGLTNCQFQNNFLKKVPEKHIINFFGPNTDLAVPFRQALCMWSTV